MFLTESLSLLTLLIPIVILLAKIIFLIYLFIQIKQISTIAYLIYVILTSFPLTYLNVYLTNLAMDRIENHNGLLWLGETTGERTANLLYSLRLFDSLINFIELILFIWLILSIIKRDR